MFSPVGIILLFYCIIIIALHIKNVKMLTKKMIELSIFTGIFLDAGYVVMIERMEVQYNYLFGFLSFLCSALYLCMCRKTKREYFLILSGLFFVVLILNILIKSVFGVEYYSESLAAPGTWENAVLTGQLETIHVNGIRISFIRIIMLMCSVLAYSELCTEKDVAILCRKISRASYLYGIFLIIETIINSLYQRAVFRNLVLYLFGQGASVSIDARSVGRIICPLGVASEPSSLSLTFFIAAVASYYAFKIYGNGKIKILMSILIILLSMGMSGVMYLIATACLILPSFRWNIKRVVIACFPIIIFGFLIFAEFIFGDRIGELLENISRFSNGTDLIYSSAVVRMYSIYNNAFYFLKYPLFGTGYGTIFSYSTLITLLANMGIVGTALFFGYEALAIAKIVNQKNIALRKLIPFMIFAFVFTGHIGHILYYEKIFFLILVAYLIIYKYYNNIPQKKVESMIRI